MQNATHDPLADLPDDNAQFLFDENPHKAIAAEAAKVVLYRRACPKCHGTGRYDAPSSLGHHRCTKCGGKGYFETKVSPEKSAARAERRAKRKQTQANVKAIQVQQQAAGWALRYAAEHAWIVAKAPHFGFAQSMSEALAKWGHLTEGQLAAVQRLMLQDATRDAERAERNAALTARTEAVDITPITTAFDKAATRLQKPRLLTPDFQFKKAPATGRNPGAIYVTDRGSDLYLGKIVDNRFTPSRECTPAMQAKVIECCKNPLEAVLAFARLTGQCGVCARKLTDPESVARGIGPVCAESYGF